MSGWVDTVQELQHTGTSGNYSWKNEVKGRAVHLLKLDNQYLCKTQLVWSLQKASHEIKRKQLDLCLLLWISDSKLSRPIQVSGWPNTKGKRLCCTEGSWHPEKHQWQLLNSLLQTSSGGTPAQDTSPTESSIRAALLELPRGKPNPKY